jgi:sRNA-binding regulator protein Hfq
MTAEELIEKGLTPKLAWAVSQGRLTWADAVARMAVEHKASSLIKKYGISRAIAIQVALGQADLTPFLKRRSLNAYREENQNRSIWNAYQESNEPLLIATVGRTFHTVRIVEVGQYEVSVLGEDGVTSSLPKLSVKYAYSPEHKEMVRQLIRRDPTYSVQESAPAKHPQNRFHLRDELLMLAIKRGTALKMKLCEGEALRAPVQWFSRFEFSVDVGDGASMVIFRHALIAGRVL